MSFWDHIKPSTPPPAATGLDLSADKRSLSIRWDDGRTTSVSARTLRQLCPCAVCVDEFTNKRRHDPSKVPESTTIQGIQPVGNYAVSFLFSDNHSTGIFNWDFLRQVSEGVMRVEG